MLTKEGIRCWGNGEGLQAEQLTKTYIVDDVESLCERLSIMAAGRIVAEGAPAALTGPLEGRLWSRVVPRGEPLPDEEAVA